MNYYARRIEDVLKELGTEKNGLTKRQVEKRIKEFGPNKIDTGKKINIWKIFLEQFTDFLILVLIAAAVLSFGLGIAYGDETYLFDGGLIVLIVLMNGLFGFFQNYKAEKSLEELEKMAVVKARVIRDGKVQEINAEELVPGDIILIEEGDEIPADARIIESSELVVDEAVLTGESLPMRKNTRILEGKTSLAERRNMVFTNTFVCSGNAKAVVALTGMRTEIGKIAKELKKVPSKPTLFQIELDKMGKKVGQGII
ncbi:HAD-IC family P-type ATPase, partial [Candidatus Micrarchaeota archaeon]|nr:HAD-IC family P-type ATPase [Candidatus Micrarchaeota archaeon]